MLLPTKMKRVEIIVPQRKFEDAMLYLRELNIIELLDVKEMIKGYGEGVSSATVSDRLYRLTTLESKINSVTTALGIISLPAKEKIPVDARISDDSLGEIEKRVSEIEQQVTSITNEKQSLESTIDYAERQLRLNIEEIMKIEIIDSPEGRNKLEEIVASIYQSLKPSELKITGPISDIVQAKAIENAVVKDISDEIARILAAKGDQAAIATAITATLGLKLKSLAKKQPAIVPKLKQN